MVYFNTRKEQVEENMKIAMIGHKRVPGREGGIEVVVEELSRRLAARGDEVVLYNRHKKGCVLPKGYRGMRLVDVPTIEKKSTDAVVYSMLSSIHALFGKYDVIHYHGIGPSAFLIIPHLFKKKVVVTVHGLNYKTPKWRGLGAKFMRFGEKIAVKYADHIIVLSREQKDYFKQKYGRETEYIPNGTTVYDIEPPDIITKKYNLKKDGYILFLSRIVPGKGLEYLLDAYREVETELPLIIAGASEYVTEFRKMIEEKATLDSRVKFTGFVEGKQLRELYSNARLFVFPSEAEGMPMCLLEALSYGCPCLVSDISENVDIGKGYVRTFRSCDREDLKEKLQQCLSKTRKDRNESRQYIIKNYSWQEVTEKTRKLYER